MHNKYFLLWNCHIYRYISISIFLSIYLYRCVCVYIYTQQFQRKNICTCIFVCWGLVTYTLLISSG